MASLQEGRESYDYNPTSYQDNGGDYSEGFSNPLRKLPSLSRRRNTKSSTSKENYEDPLEFEEAFDFLTEGFNLYENDRSHISGHLYDESQSGVTRLALGGYPTTTN
jgi:hypothetical protein